MKAILHFVKAIVVFMAFMIAPKLYAQPEYVFRNATLVSGSNLQVNAVYSFSNVKPGVDAQIQITAITGGVAISELDGNSTGHNDAFQPFIFIPPNSNGYVEFELRFYAAGTTNLMNQAFVPMTPIDVDGSTYPDGNLYETDQIQLLSGYYIRSGATNEIAVGRSNSVWVWGRNTTGWSYPGVDTSAKNVMFTVVNGGVNTIRFRTGATNSSPTYSEVRLRSIYFKNFTYVNGLLPENVVTDFRGTNTANQVKLQCNFSAPQSIKSVIVERAGKDMNFNKIGEISLFNSKSDYNFVDESFSGLSFYRLKLILQNDNIVYSNILRFENDALARDAFKVFPTVTSNQVTVQVKNNSASAASLQLFDYNGRLVRTQQVQLQSGNQNFTVTNLSQLNKGNYIVVLKTGEEQFRQPIVVQ